MDRLGDLSPNSNSLDTPKALLGLGKRDSFHRNFVRIGKGLWALKQPCSGTSHKGL